MNILATVIALVLFCTTYDGHIMAVEVKMAEGSVPVAIGVPEGNSVYHYCMDEKECIISSEELEYAVWKVEIKNGTAVDHFSTSCSTKLNGESGKSIEGGIMKIDYMNFPRSLENNKESIGEYGGDVSLLVGTNCAPKFDAPAKTTGEMTLNLTMNMVSGDTSDISIVVPVTTEYEDPED